MQNDIASMNLTVLSCLDVICSFCNHAVCFYFTAWQLAIFSALAGCADRRENRNERTHSQRSCSVSLRPMQNALLKTLHPARAQLLNFLIGANLAGSGACEKSAVLWQMTPLSFALFLGARSNQKALTRSEEPILSFKQTWFSQLWNGELDSCWRHLAEPGGLWFGACASLPLPSCPVKCQKKRWKDGVRRRGTWSASSRPIFFTGIWGRGDALGPLVTRATRDACIWCPEIWTFWLF